MASSPSSNVGFGGLTTGSSNNLFTSPKLVSSFSAAMSSTITSSAINRAHCSLGQGGGGTGGGGSIMEIREMTGYCATDKYWNHHHQHSSCSMVPGGATATGRHSTVYPPVFYTPPPPQVYSSSCTVTSGPISGVATGTADWSCPPPPPAPHADSYSHFLYTQYSSHNDMTNYLPIPTSCYDTDILMLGQGASGLSMQIPSQYPSVPANNPYEQSHQTSSTYSAIPPQSTYLGAANTGATISTSSTATIANGNSPKQLPIDADESSVSSSSSSAIDSSSENLEDDTEDDEEAGMISTTEGTAPFSLLAWCVLCKKSTAAVTSTPTPQPPTSPPLSRLLENIDDDDLDISVCSGDIEIGGIEDEMIQQDTESLQQNPFKITLGKLAKLTKLPLSVLLPEDQCEKQENSSDDYFDSMHAVLCSKCQKLVDTADSLDKQLTLVINSINQITKSHNDSRHNVLLAENNHSSFTQVKFSSVSTQTSEIITEDAGDSTKTFRYILVRRHDNQISLSKDNTIHNLKNHDPPETSSSQPLWSSFLCHECGRLFNCGRNLGKHIRRKHLNAVESSSKSKMLVCTREGCTKTFSDNAKMKFHLQTHTNDKRHFCSKCFQLFSSKSNLCAHLKLKVCLKSTLNDAIISDSQTKASSAIINAVEEDTGALKGGSYRCENCGLSFRTETRFLNHNSKSSCRNSKVSQCEICSKVFSKPSELKAHESVHLGRKPFPCDICGLAFSTRGNQRVHQRTHSQHKRFKCSLCGKGFTRNQTLQSHLINLHKT